MDGGVANLHIVQQVAMYEYQCIFASFVLFFFLKKLKSNVEYVGFALRTSKALAKINEGEEAWMVGFVVEGKHKSRKTSARIIQSN